MPDNPGATPASPCIRNCCLDKNDVCIGCHRSLMEIMAWGTSSTREKRAILERAAQRQAYPDQQA